MQTFQYGFTCLLLVLFSKTAHAGLGDSCPGGNSDCDSAGNNEVCSTDGSEVCVCNSAGSWSAGSITNTICYQAVDLGNACTATDECLLGNGASGTVCETNCIKDCGPPTNQTGYILTAGTGASATYQDATATVTCATGYSEASGPPAAVACQADGSWADPAGCVVDCGTPTNPTGYTFTASAGTQQGNTATVACATGYTGTPSPATVTCQAGGSWPTSTGCNAVDCSALTAPTNGTIAYSSGTTYESVATFSCDTGYAVTGSATRTCGADGSWSGSNPTCEMNGAGGIRQKFSLVVLIGALVLALM